MNIMIVTNSAYLRYARIMLYSLFLHHTDVPMDIYLPYEDLTEQELKELADFIRGFPGKRLILLYVGTEFKENVVSRNGINVETYYRILGMKQLPQEVHRILYLDVDMVIQGSLQQLYHSALEGHPFAVCEDIYGKINGFHQGNMRRLGIPQEYSYFNAGVMLYNMDYLREDNAVDRMLDNIYRDYERYEYNDQDVMNEMYYDKLVWVGWDEYNCPPAWYYLNRQRLQEGQLEFADYNEMRVAGDAFLEKYQNMTKAIYGNAKIVHYLGNTKPWSLSREAAAVYDIFDEAYELAEQRYESYMQQQNGR